MGEGSKTKGVGAILERSKTAALVRAAAKGDKDAFVRLIDDHRQTMYATAMAVTRNEDDALDAIQDAILTLWEKLDTLKDPWAFKTWMTRILVNCCCGGLRGRKREAPAEDLEQAEIGIEPDLDTALDVDRALSRLPEDDRLILQLYYFEDLPVNEIAKALGIKAEAVRMRLSRGRKRFKEQYEKEALT